MFVALRKDLILRSPQSGRLEGRIAPIQADAGLESPLDATPKRVCIGVIAGAHGVQGAVRVKSFTADPKDVARYGPVEDEKGERRFSLRLAGSAKGVVIARLKGIVDRNQAEALRGLRLYLPRAALPPTADEEYYHADLIGLEAALGDGTPLGRVRAVHDFGAGDTLEIERSEGPPAMVPFTRAIVPVVDIAAGRLVLDPPPGLIDDPAPARVRRARARTLEPGP
jgi:16S rRNA processing protein RimM